MSLQSWISSKQGQSRRRPISKAVGHAARHCVEQLENRLLLSTVQFSAGSETVNESTGAFSIPVTLSQANPSGSVSVPVMLGGTATAGTDYSGVTASPLVIPQGQTTGTITGTLLTDPGPSQTLSFSLGTPSAGYTLGSPSVNTLTITEPAVTSLSTLTVPANALVGNSVTVSTTLTRVTAPAGDISGTTVLFTLSGPDSLNRIVTTDASGTASATFQLGAPGIYSVTASFAGTSSLTTASTTSASFAVYQRVLFSVSPASATAGTPVTLSAALTTFPGGAPLANVPVTFSFSDGTPSTLAETDSSGVATVIETFRDSGTVTATASISAANMVDSFYATSAGTIGVAETSSQEFLVASAVSSLSALTAPTSALIGNTITVSTTLSSVSAPASYVAGQAVQFLVTDPSGGTTLSGIATTNAAGVASYTFPPSLRGVYSISASFAGSSALASSSASAVTVAAYQRTSLSIPASVTSVAGEPVTLSAALTTFPGGTAIAGQTITFSFGGAAAPLFATTDSNGDVTVSANFPSAGSFTETASFSNSGAFFADQTGAVPVVPTTATAPVTVSLATTSLAALSAPSTAVVGNPITVSTTLTPVNGPVNSVVGQTVQFTVIDPSEGTTLSGSAITGSGGVVSYTFSPSFRGHYSISASFAGTSALASSSSGGALVQAYQPTSISAPTTASAVAGAQVSLAATLTTVPAGVPIAGETIQFSFGGVIPPQSVTTDSNGVATVTVTFPTNGSFSVATSFLDATNYYTNSTGAFPVIADTASTQVTVSSATTSLAALTAPATALIGNSVTVSTTLSRTTAPAGPLGAEPVQFTVTDPSGGITLSGTATTGANGFVAYTFTPSLRGVYSISAGFAGTSALASSSSSAVTATVYQRTSLFIPAPASSIAGEPVSLSAALTAFPGGAGIAGQIITFSFGGVIAPLSAATDSNGDVTVSANFPSAGSFTETASFSNPGGFFADQTGAVPVVPTTATAPVTVGLAATSLAALSAPPIALVGSAITVSTTLSSLNGPPSSVVGQTVQFSVIDPSEGTTLSGSAITGSAGVASYTFTPSLRGIYSVSASFAGTSALASSSYSGAAVPVYQRTSLTLAPGTPTAGVPTTLSATLSALPGGAPISGQTVTFDFAGAIPDQSAITNVNGVATISATFPNAGSFTETASFSNPTGFYTNSTGAFPVVPTIATAQVNVSQAVTSLSAPNVPAGAILGSSFMASTQLTQVSTPAGPVSGATVTFTLTRVADGVVVSMSSVTTDSSGIASVTFPATALQIKSDYTVSASYAGSAALAASISSTATVPVYQKSSLSLSSATPTAGVPATLSATLTALFPGGGPIIGQTVLFDFGGAIPDQSATTDIHGVATISATFPTAGVVTETASFLNAGALFTDHTGSIPPVAEVATGTINVGNTTSTAISAPSILFGANGVVTVTVSSSGGTPTGSVSLIVDGAPALTQALSAGVATFTLAGLGEGDHSLSASYSAQGNFGASTGTGTLTVLTPAPLGYYSPNGAAPGIPAPPGSYVGTTGATSATLDPLGTYTSQSGASAPIPAPPGSFVGTMGATSATLDPIGTYTSQSGASAPIPAPPGSFVGTMGATSATLDPIGTYTSQSGASAPIPAPPGSFVGTMGASSATLDPIGTYTSQSGASAPIPAPPGSFVGTMGATSATLDPLGTYTSQSGASAPTPAPPGSFVGTMGATSATLDPIGTYTSQSGASAPTPAPPGSFVGTIGATSATLDPIGTYTSQSGASAPTPAPPGSFVSTMGASSATLDPLGTYTNQSGASAPIPAPPGSYVPTTGATHATLASPGYYVPNAGATQETPGDPGYYVPNAGATAEILDPPGTYSGPAATTYIAKIATTTTTVGAGPFVYTGTAHIAGSGTVSATDGLSTAATSLTYSSNSDGTGTPDFIDAGIYYVTAHYAGDGTHLLSNGAAVAITINKATTTIALSSNFPGGANPGQSVTFTATVAAVAPGAGVPTGTVQFYVDGVKYAAVTETTGIATVSDSALSLGSHAITATYTSGTTNFSGSTTATTLSQSIVKFTATVSNLSAPTIVLNTPLVTLGGQIAGSPNIAKPTGTVAITVFYGGVQLVTQTAALNSSGAFSSTFLSLFAKVGQYTLVYNYSGDANYAASSSTVYGTITYGVQPTCTPAPVKHGGTVAITLELTDVFGLDFSSASETVTPTGIALASNPTAISPLPTGNAATFTYSKGIYTLNLKTTNLTAGTYVLYFTAAGDPVTHSVQFVLS